MNNKPLALIIAAAISGLGSVARAEPSTNTDKFTPIEKLEAGQRAQLLEAARKNSLVNELDWEKHVLGINSQGSLEIRNKDTLELEAMVLPSCQ